MSQLLTPANGGVIPEIQTTTTTPQLNVLSEQFILANGLQERPTEWAPEGRPIYRRLPATSQTYQVNFFEISPEPDNLASGIVKDIGYVYIPWGELDNGENTLLVSVSESKKSLLVKSGTIVWKYGSLRAIPTIIDLEVLEVGRGKFDLAYQLIYDDAPSSYLYSVDDFALTGLPLNITSSTDSVVGWRFGAVNAFTNTSNQFWANEDSYFPAYSQPSTAYLQWQSNLAQSYRSLTLRCPSGTAYTGTATLFYVNGAVEEAIETVPVKADSSGQFFQFNPPSPKLQTSWKVSFSSNVVSIQSITVSGVLTLTQKKSGPGPQSRLVMYPSGTLPDFETNSNGEEIPTSYCYLATVEIGREYNVERLQDTRQIIRRDYVPVADWLTAPFDENLIDLYEQVSDYANLWMAPPKCLKQEYVELETKQITVEV